ncbi:hypothetical protein NH340_JMT06225 [Sarcoptes scabiei]|nr:hypothetical protein NH340_JMT06225 [Sarcoptes scabiei]
MAVAVAPKILRRNPKGCRSEQFYNWPEEQFEDMDSTIAVQQYIQQLIRQDPSNIEKILTPPKGQDLGTWKYEHVRQFCLELNRLTVKLQDECSPETCSQMTATEQWIFLCAAHKAPKECPAIDYTRHTLDGASALLNSNKYFPSRVTIKESSVAKFGSVCRRVYRIFSHAYYHHKAIYDEFENESFLCKRFSIFSLKYDLMSVEGLIVPIPGLDLNEIKKCSNSVESAIFSGNSVSNSTTSTASISSNENEDNNPDSNATSIQNDGNITLTASSTSTMTRKSDSSEA